jgi:hypothetical protein
MEYLSSMAAATVVLGFIWGIFSVAILRPLNNSIVELRDATKALRAEMHENEERRHQQDIKIAEIDQRARSAHHRIDEIMGIKTPPRRE